MSCPNHARRIAVFSAALTMACVACGDGGPGLHSDGLPLWALEPELRIGSVDDPAYAFTYVNALEVGGDGSIYSLHEQDAVVRRWTPDGRPADTLGRRGEGPGEFTDPRALGWHGDSLWVMDGGDYRISFFRADGSFLGSVVPRVDLGTRELAEEGIRPPRPGALLADGSVYAVTPAFSHDVVEGRLAPCRRPADVPPQARRAPPVRGQDRVHLSIA